MESDELIRWALSADLPSTRAIGQHAVGRVLVALATYADARGVAWPSTYTLEADISGLSRRDIRNALEALERAQIIANIGRVGRAVRWKLSAGYPAQEPEPESAGTSAGESAGTSAGESAGTSAGYPAPNRSEEISIKTPASPPVTRTRDTDWRDGNGQLMSWKDRAARASPPIATSSRKALQTLELARQLEQEGD